MSLAMKLLMKAGAAHESELETFVLINPQVGESSIVERNGLSVTTHGDAFLNTSGEFTTPTIDLTANANSDPYTHSYVCIGSAGDFNFLHDGSTPWTVEWIMYADRLAQDVFSTCYPDWSQPGFTVLTHDNGYGTKWLTPNMISVSGGGLVIGENIVSPALEANLRTHLALTFDPVEAPYFQMRLFVDGVFAGWAGPYMAGFDTVNSSGPFILGAIQTDIPWTMFRGHFLGLRIVKEILYPGTDTFVPPLVF